MAIDQNNRWVKLSQCILWNELVESYYQGLATERGRPTKEACVAIGTVMIKHKQCLSDVETVQQIQETPICNTLSVCRATSYPVTRKH